MCVIYIYVTYVYITYVYIYIYINMYIILDFVPRIGSRKVFYRKNLISHSKKTLFSCNYFQAASTVLGEMGWKAQQRAAGRCWV